jgi:hypothetical protein
MVNTSKKQEKIVKTRKNRKSVVFRKSVDSVYSLFFNVISL